MIDPPFLFLSYKLKVIFYPKMSKITTEIHLQHGIAEGGTIILREHLALIQNKLYNA